MLSLTGPLEPRCCNATLAVARSDREDAMAVDLQIVSREQPAPADPRISLAWQRHSEPGPAARAEAVVAPPGTNRPGCARSRQGTEFAESRFRASRVTFVRRQRPYRRSPRSRSSGCCSARAKRSSHRCRDKRCSVSSISSVSLSAARVPARSRMQKSGSSTTRARWTPASPGSASVSPPARRLLLRFVQLDTDDSGRPRACSA